MVDCPRCHAAPPSEPPPTPSSRAHAGDRAIGLPLLLTLALLAAFAPIATDLYLPGFPAIARDLAVDASGVQLTLTTFLIGLACGQLVMGPISDRFGRRLPLIASAVLCVAAGALAAAAPHLAVLVVARLIQGLAGAGGMVIGRAIIADLVTGRAAARAFTLMMTVGGVAPVLAPLVGGLLVRPDRLARHALDRHRAVRRDAAGHRPGRTRDPAGVRPRGTAPAPPISFPCGGCCGRGVTGATRRSSPSRSR